MSLTTLPLPHISGVLGPGSSANVSLPSSYSPGFPTIPPFVVYWLVRHRPLKLPAPQTELSIPRLCSSSCRPWCGSQRMAGKPTAHGTPHKCSAHLNAMWKRNSWCSLHQIGPPQPCPSQCTSHRVQLGLKQPRESPLIVLFPQRAFHPLAV